MLILTSGTSLTDVFGYAANSFEVDFVTIGSPGNPPDAIRIQPKAIKIPLEEILLKQ